MHEGIWVCPRCSAQNETWRRWCRSCPETQTPALVATPIAPAVQARGPDRVHPAIAIAMIAAILIAGAGAYVVLRPKHTTAVQTATTDSVPAASTDSSAPALNNDQVMAALTWTADDAPAGWSSTALTPEASVSADLLVPSCEGGPAPRDPVAHADAPMFTNGDYTAVEAVELQSTTQTVVDDYNTISNGALVDCIRGQVESALAPLLRCSCTGINVTVVPITPPPTAPSTTYAFRFTIDRAGYVGAQVDAYWIAQGRAELTLLFVAEGGPFPADARTSLITKMLQRLANTPTTDKTY